MILITGATGYIGSHTWVEMLLAGHNVAGVDDFSNSQPKVLERIKKITGQIPNFCQGDICDSKILNDLFQRYPIKGVIHFAALKAVGESVSTPLKYYEKNIVGLLTLLKIMRTYTCKTFVLSSSATVYHPSNPLPYREEMPLGSTSPYGWTKFMNEQILRDLEVSDPIWKVAYLRYFNPVGAHESGLIGEDPKGIPNNLMPYVAQVAVGKRQLLTVYGGDWPTVDGTGVRDYIHVTDLAKGHIRAFDYLLNQKKSLTINLGAGKGYSVLELICAFEKSAQKQIPYEVVGRRPGDIAAFYADASLAEKLLGWKAEFDLDRMCQDSWRWQLMNPNGLMD